MSKNWKNNEISYLERYAATKELAELTRRFGTDEAELRAKLKELDLTTKDGAGKGSGPGGDPLVKDFEAGLEALHAEKWKKAAESLEKVAGGDLNDLAARARQYLRICRRHLEPVEEEKDPFLQAVYLKNGGELKRALKLCEKAGKKDERFVYLEASLHAIAGRGEEAEKALRRAIELNPDNRVHAFHDPDFAELRQNQEFAPLFGLG